MSSNLAEPVESLPAVEASLRALGAQPASKLLALIAQLGLLLLVVDQFQIGGSAFLRILMLAIAGFAVRFALPQRFQLTFFVALSLIASVWVLGPLTAAWLVVMGLLILAICHLPVSFLLRWGLVTTLFGVLAVYRIEWLSAPWDRAIWPVLGAVFLFRTVIYLEDLRHEGRCWSWETALAYFFLLPNACFPLFPVVDFKTFRRAQDDDDRYWISQVGIRWMTRGVIHLVLYRLVYLYVTIAPSDVATAWDVARFVVSGFALYLRVSGIFHLVVGMLHLFGFNLPETHHLYFLSSGINDLWRRINIYWKDFMMKLFFYPAYFKLRRRGTSTALILAMAYVVLVTWFLHCVQWFWIQGSFPLRWQDGVFWTILAGLMTLGSIREMQSPRWRATSARSWIVSLGQHSLRVGATFMGMCILWSMWTSDSFSEWIGVWSVLAPQSASTKAAHAIGPASVVFGTLLLTVPVVIREIPQPVSARKAMEKAGRAPGLAQFWRLSSAVAMALLALAIAGSPATWRGFGRNASDLATSLRRNQLNQIDMAKLQRGYYEDLLNTDNVGSRLWEIEGEKPKVRSPLADITTRPTFDYRMKELAPFVIGARFRTNGWGMRGKEYTRVKPSRTYRIAALGDSWLLGAGVADDQTFAALLEKRLNRELSPDTGLHYEILNFGVGGYSPMQRLLALERKALAFNPDAVMYFAHKGDSRIEAEAGNISKALELGLSPPWPYVRNIMRLAGTYKGISATEASRRLRPYGPRLQRWVLEKLQQDCQERKTLLLWVLLPSLWQPSPTLNYTMPSERPGFIPMRIDQAFSDKDLKRVTLAQWSQHPNAEGHRMIAAHLFEEIKKRGGADLLRPDSSAMKFTQETTAARLSAGRNKK